MATPQQEVKATVTQNAPVVEAKGMVEVSTVNSIPKKRQDEMLGKVAEEPASQRQRYYFLELNLEGEPVGSVLRDAPKDKPYISVLAVLPTDSSLVTPSGAPLTDQMNPDHSFFDPALAERNPVPKNATPRIGDTIARNTNLHVSAGSDAHPQPAKESAPKHVETTKK